MVLESRVLIVDESDLFPISKTGRLGCCVRHAKRSIAKLISPEVTGSVGFVNWGVATQSSLCSAAHGNLND